MIKRLYNQWLQKERPPCPIAEPEVFWEPNEPNGAKSHRYLADETPPWDYAWVCEDCHLPMHAIMSEEKYADCLTNMMRMR